MSRPEISFIAFGSNMGNREHFIEQALLELSLHPEIMILKQSSIIETGALEVTSQPDFLNGIAKIRTSLLPMDLLITLQGIELKTGRIKRYDKGPREIDLDILTYENYIMDSEYLQIPHHSLFTRPFIKEILLEMGEGSLIDNFKEFGLAKYSQFV